MITSNTLKSVNTTTIQPAVCAINLPPNHHGNDNGPSIIPKPTDNDTMIPVNQTARLINNAMV